MPSAIFTLVPTFGQAFSCKPGDANAGAGGKDHQIW